MTLSLRRRMVLTVLPLVLILLGFSGAGTLLLLRLGKRSDAILRENYDSVRAMDRLKLAVLAGDWSAIEAQYQIEKDNITILPEEEQLVRQLRTALEEYRADPRRRSEVLRLAEEIRNLNEQHMLQANQNAQDSASQSVLFFATGLAAAVVFAAFGVWWLQRTILGPIRSVTDAATAIGQGELHLLVPVPSQDEIGRLAEAFNLMTAKLRAYRQTDTERLLRARQTSQATIDSFPDPVVVIDTRGCIELANPAAQRILGVRQPDDGETRTPWMAPESLREQIAVVLRQQQPLVTLSFDQALTFRVNASELIYLPQIRPIRSTDGRDLGASIVLEDVTRFRLLDRLKSDWVATVSHELKTPLTSVRLAVHVLLEEVVGPLEPKQVELLVEARESTERLLKLIEQLLSLAKLEDGREQLDLHSAEVSGLLRAAAEDVAARAEDQRIEITVADTSGLPPVTVDSARIGRALNNLLNNALTYTEPGGKVTLTASAAGDRVRLSVSDTGIGIPPEYLPHVFDRFFRVPGRDSTPGTGLGLAIVREIVTAHGGDITCESESGVGTTFHINLPASEVRT